VTALALAAPAGADSRPAMPAPDELVARGERLYREGVGAGGSAVAALVQGDIQVRSTEMACVNCHRRSGWGTTEGPVTVPPVVGPVLFAALTRGHPEMGPVRRTGAGTRDAYDEATLLRAVRDGVDPGGRLLSPSMPRFQLSDGDSAALAAYLRLLSAQPVPGVDEDTIHLATVLTPGLSAGQRSSLLDVLRTYVRHKNAGTRDETRRRRQGPWDMAQHYAVYRNWALHEWELRGEPRDWPAQLEALYRDRPVFAILSGLSDEDWGPVHEFCERHQLPAVMPQAPLVAPAEAGHGFYSLYFSRGVALEAETLAGRLASEPRAQAVLQVARCGGVGEAAAARLAGAAAPPLRVESRCIDPAVRLDASKWQELLSGRPDRLVLWLGRADAPALEALGDGATPLGGVDEIYVSSTLLGEGRLSLPRGLAERTLRLHPFVAPEAFDAHAVRALSWMSAHGLAPSDRAVAANALVAATLVSDALAHPRALASREYFVERIEHMASRSPTRGAYAAVSFDPSRRFASSACLVLRATPAPRSR
jgi:hypothetical protein